MIEVGHSLVIKEKINKIIELLKKIENLYGDYAEVGVYKGGTAIVISENSNSSVHLFDTFEGIPYHTENIDGTWYLGTLNDVDITDIIKLFEDQEHVKIYKGIFPIETSKNIENNKFKFVHLDVDNYQSYKESLEFFYERMVTNGIIVFDDYNCECCPGAKLAIDEFFADKKEKLIFDDVYYITKK